MEPSGGARFRIVYWTLGIGGRRFERHEPIAAAVDRVRVLRALSARALNRLQFRRQ
jgi:hypothetical protein